MSNHLRLPETSRRTQSDGVARFSCEAEVVEGIESLAREEIVSRLGNHVAFVSRADGDNQGAIRFEYMGRLRALFKLRTVTAVYLLRHFPVPRPRALLGHEHFHALLDDIRLVREIHPVDAFQTLHLDAAGSHSSVMSRLKLELSQHTGLAIDEDAGDLQIRMRRSAGPGDGWEVLIRLTPRPLATRAWRVCNYEGALNATVAYTMSLLSRPRASDTFLNLGCGSGSILIERLECAPARRAIGCELSERALACARANISASPYCDTIELVRADMRAVPFSDRSVDTLCADLPFGQRVGSHEANRSLYPRMLDEAARVAKPDASFIIITHEIRLIESILLDSPAWSIEAVLKITLRGLHPRIYVLRRND